MGRHNVRVRAHRLIKTFHKSKEADRAEKLHMFTKIVMEKQALRERYIKLMDDAERSFGRKEALYLLRDAEIIWKKINGCLF